jgi:hypothetical protein
MQGDKEIGHLVEAQVVNGSVSGAIGELMILLPEECHGEDVGLSACRGCSSVGRSVFRDAFWAW